MEKIKRNYRKNRVKTLNLRVSEEEKTRIQEICKSQGLTYTQGILQAIELLKNS